MFKVMRNRFLSFGLRLVLGGILVGAGLGKLPNVEGFADYVNKFSILPWPWAHYYALVLPWAELVIGTFIIVGFVLPLATAASFLLTLTFIVATLSTLVRPFDEASCGCFGTLLTVPPWAALTVDVLMLMMALVIMFRSGDLLNADSMFSGRLRGMIRGRAH